MTEFILIAHRGASGDYPENTLLAFREALKARTTWLELDVQLSSDGQLVVIHDTRLQRTTSGRGVVKHKTLAQLRQLDAGWGEPIPLLSEVLDLAAGRASVNIELKGAGTALPVAGLLKERGQAPSAAGDSVLVSSLSEEELSLFAREQPQIRVAPVADRVDECLWRLADELDAWSVHVEKSCITKGVIAQARQSGRKLLAYTVNDAETLQRFRQAGLDGVFTDFPQLVLRERGEAVHGR